MEKESLKMTYNKRRAEGKDKNDKPKNLQLKVRKLNPVNTLCYFQVHLLYFHSVLLECCELFNVYSEKITYKCECECECSMWNGLSSI